MVRMEPLPPLLYKFRPLTNESDWARVSEILLKKQLWFSSVDRFNDPFEGLVALDIRKTDQKTAREWSTRVGAHIATGNREARRTKIQEVVRRVKHGMRVNGLLPGVNEIGICCLMETVDSLLAWSHYTNGHRGLAIGFRPRPELPGNLFSFSHRVLYAENKPIDDIVHGPRAKAFDSALLTKAKCWDYEKEWRLISDPMVPDSMRVGARANSAATFTAEAVLEVRIGAKLSDIDRRRLVLLLKESGMSPQLFSASLHPTKYEIVFHKLQTRELVA